MPMLVRFNKGFVYEFNTKNSNALSGHTGLYLIFLNDLNIPYPYADSPLIYIGMSESSQNSIGNRLKDHITGRSNNQGITGYLKKWKLSFTYLDIEFLKHIFITNKIESIETYFLEDFSNQYGTYPICNNKRGALSSVPPFSQEIEIEWNFFGGKHDR